MESGGFARDEHVILMKDPRDKLRQPIALQAPRSMMDATLVCAQVNKSNNAIASINISIVFTASRTYSCTERLCLRKKRSVPNGRHCTPGQQWKNDCNDCFCTETGIAACTLRGCLPFRVGHPHITIIHPNRNHTFNGNQFRRNQTTTSTNEAVDVASTAVVTNVENGLDHHQTTT